MTQKYEKCSSTDNLTTDHIIPQLLFDLANKYHVKLPFTRNDPRNTRVLCSGCNAKKEARIEHEHAREFIDLLRQGFEAAESRGGYVPAKDKNAFKRFHPLNR